MITKSKPLSVKKLAIAFSITISFLSLTQASESKIETVEERLKNHALIGLRPAEEANRELDELQQHEVVQACLQEIDQALGEFHPIGELVDRAARLIEDSHIFVRPKKITTQTFLTK